MNPTLNLKQLDDIIQYYSLVNFFEKAKKTHPLRKQTFSGISNSCEKI